jgi:CheY-like chemotaxis protein
VILIVDDDADIREALTELLTAEGYQVVAVANGQSALDQLQAGPRPTVIILDLMMPVMNGWDFRLQQQQDPALSAIPVIILTATDLITDTVRAQFGDARFLTKPVDLDALLALVRNEENRQNAKAAKS